LYPCRGCQPSFASELPCPLHQALPILSFGKHKVMLCPLGGKRPNPQ
jgi:hypothetical protein